MKTKRFTPILLVLLALLIGAGGATAYGSGAIANPNVPTAPLGTAFTYQGRLTDGGSPATGSYDFRFILYNASSGGAQVGGTITKQNVTVTDGYFTVELDFSESGEIPFNGDARWLEIGVKPSGSSVDYSTFSARQALNPAPYAIYAASTGEHNHLGETWVGDYNDMVITGTFSGAALWLSNSGLDGLVVQYAGDHGVSVYHAAVAGFSVNEVGSPLATNYSLDANGFEVEGTMGNGLYVGWADKKGVYVYESSGDGLNVRKASGSNANGLYIGETDNNGVYVNNAGWHGLLVSSAGGDGVSIGSAKGKGVHVGQSDDNGLNIQSAGEDGVHVDSVGSPSTSYLSIQKNGFEVAGAEGHGVFVGHADINGLEVGSTGFDGLYVAEAGRDGVRVVSVINNGLSVYSATNDGVYIESAGGDFIQAGPDSDPKFKVTNTGDVYADGAYHCTAPCTIQNGNADFAEVLPSSTSLEPGDVLVISLDGQLDRSTQTYQTNVAGVYSTEPGYLGGGEFMGQEGYAPLAVVGVVPVKVSAENGPIKPGDLLTTSTTPGHAMRINDPQPGTILGKALEPLESGTGMILVLVTLQ